LYQNFKFIIKIKIKKIKKKSLYKIASPKRLTKEECKKKGFRYRKSYSYERMTKDRLKNITVKAN